ncbi:MAG: mechanosensitive ion channel domain-containing protein [Polyangiales bacterium]
MSRRSAPLWLAIVMGLGLVGTSAIAQTSPLPSPVEDADPRETSPELLEIDRKMQELRARLQSWQAKAAEYQRAGEEAQSRAEIIDEEVVRLQERKAIDVPEAATAAELAAQLVEAEQDLAAARREATELDAESQARAERRRRVPELLLVAKQRLRELESTPIAAGSDAAETEAFSEIGSLRREALLAEIEAYQNELASYEVRGALLSKSRDRATLRIAYYQALSTKLREATQRMGLLKVESENEAAKKLLKELTALPEGFKQTLEELYLRNEALASIWTGDGGLYQQIQDVSEKLARAETKVAKIESELVRLAARVEAVGLADSVGALLRQHRAEAPDIGMYQRFIRMRQEQIGDVQVQQIKLREQRQALTDIDALVGDVMASVDEPVSPEARREVEQLLQQLFETQRRYMDALIDDYETYFQKLVDFDASQHELIDRTKDLLDFIDERILWIPSGKAVQPELLSDGRDAMTWLLSPEYWAQLGRAFREAVTKFWPVNLLVLILVIVFVPLARRARRRLEVLGETARRPDCAAVAPTIEALLITLGLALWLPAVSAYLAWRLGLSPVATQFTRSFAYGLLVASAFWATVRLCRHLVRPDGIAGAHCGWPAAAAQSLWRNLRWFAALALPAVFIIFLFEARGEDLWRESVGRVAFSLSMLAVAAFNYLALRSDGPVTTVMHGGEAIRPWVWRMLQISSILVPFGLIFGALYGFYWTSLQLAIRLHLSVVLVFLVVFSIQLYARWAMVSERRAALEDDELSDVTARPTPTMQVSRLMIGTGILIVILGLLAVWADLLPATRILHQVELWNVTQKVTVSEVDPSGVERFATDERLVAITLAELVRSIFIILLTVVFMRAVPGLLEATLFRGLGHGVRYAYSTIAKYAVVLVGLALAFDAIGIGWSSIQWLVAAIGVGLGFGLQEIFANFISGLIILFERPIRVGDVVTVGEVSGTVSRIRTRATWITAFDRKELLVPNKEFVTGRLINWSLSDAVLRLSISVGIAYGSDTIRAIEVLEQVARESRRVLREPRPQVLFVAFGDSSLSFELRVFVRSAEQLFAARHDLHMGIDTAFREAGIEIAFPQRDLHLRSLPAEMKLPPSRTD